MSMTEISTAIGEVIGANLSPKPAARVHGGCINKCYRWESSVGPLFVKIASSGRRAMLEAEAAGLAELARADAVRVPRVLGVGAGDGVAARSAWLVLEWIQFGARTDECEAHLGRQLAQQHRVSAAAFGWHRDNTIGSTPQLNGWMDDWVAFFRERRLRFQLSLARENGHGARLQPRGELLLELMGGLFRGPAPRPSLLHGDLWGGNWACDEAGTPVIFDPAVYYGDRLADLAMTRLFGGFGADFYAAYGARSPLEQGAEARLPLYNLYHVLNHLNLFGVGYLAQARSTIDGLLAELGH